MKFLFMETAASDLRSMAHGWSHQDTEMVHTVSHRDHRHIGLVPSWPRGVHRPCPEAPLYAIADGWKLMAPPTKTADDCFDWWFTRE